MLLSILSVLAGLALAQGSPDPGDPPSEPAVPVPVDPVMQAELVQLRADLELARAALAERAQGDQDLEQALALLAQLVDGRQDDAQRVAAAEALGLRADPSFIPFFYNAVHVAPAPVKVAALQALRSTPTPEVTEIASWALERGPTDEVRRAAMDLLADIPEDAAGEVLYTFALNPDQPEALRAAAIAALEAGHAALLEARGRPTPPVKGSGPEASLGIAANGVAGGILLSSIGVWGQTDAGIVIGAVGGSLVGVGTGVTYALTRPVSVAQNLQYAGGVGWGLELAVLSTQAIYGDRYPDGREEVGALLRAAGVAGGAGLALARFKADPDPVDVVELNLSMLLGQQIGFGLAHVALDRGYGYGDVAWDLDTQPRMAAALGATALGAGAGWWLRDAWQLDGGDAAFATATGLEMLWLGSWLPIAVTGQGHLGAPRLGWAGGTAAALAFSEWQAPSLARTGAMSYSFLAGTALGAGLPLLARSEDDRTIAGTMLGVGAAGAVGGYLVGDLLDMDGGSYTTLAVGLPITVAELVSLAYILDMRGVVEDGQIPGIILAGGGVGAAGLLGLTQLIEPSPGEAVVAGSGAVWGAWYGVLTPLALGLELEGDQYVLSALGAGDALMAAAIVAQSDRIGLDPRSTLFPQIGGVGGATLGALGAALFTGDSQTIAGGAVLGSLLGFGGGALVELRVGSRRQAAWALPRPSLDLPGHWSVGAVPLADEDGHLGGQVTVSAVGW